MYRIGILVICAVLSGCAVVAPAQLAKPEQLSPVPGGGDSKTIFVANISSKLIDKKIGQLKGGLLCVGGTDLVWQDNPGVLNSMREQMTKTLSENGYRVYSGLIQSSGEKSSDILVGVAVEDIKANICYSVNGMKGAASLKLRWEVLDNETGKSFLLTSSGSGEVLEFSSTGDPEVFLKATAMATENMLAQEKFFNFTKK